MQTNFTLAQLADPDTAVSEKILRSCVHCGFCTATCPTYVLLGDELDSPRGRIYLIKDMLENDKPANEEVTLHIDRCLSCLACMTTCPSGRRLHAPRRSCPRADRDDLPAALARPRCPRRASPRSCRYPARFRAAIAAALLGEALRRPHPAHPRPVAPRADGRARAGAAAAALARTRRNGIFPAEGERKGRVALLRGCAQSVLDPGINDAAIRLLTPERHRGRVRRRRGLLRRARPPHGPRAASRMRRRSRTSTPGSTTIDGGRARRDRRHHVGLRHDDQGLRLHVPRRSRLCREGRRASRRSRRTSREYLETLDLGAPAQSAEARRRLSLRLLAAARPAGEDRAEGAARQSRLRGARAGRGPSLLRLGRHLQHAPAGDFRCGCASARWRTSRRPAPRSSPPATSAASPRSAQGRGCRSCTRSNCSTGPMAVRVPQGSPTEPRH